MIKLIDIKKTYHRDGVDTDALKGINLEIRDGEMLAIMGPSGSGKSSLLNIIGALDTPDSGLYYYNNVDIYRLKKEGINDFRKNNISFIFQQFMLMSDYTVFENVEVPLRLREIKRKDRKKIVLKILEELDLYDVKSKRPKYLSGGQKQRVAIARAICMDTDLILADEPTGSIDSENAKNVISILRNLNMNGKTIIIVTHDSMVAESCDRVVYMRDGVIVDGS